jgi:hypothetical protein
MVIITVCYLLSTLLEGVDVYSFNICTKFLPIFSDKVRFVCWPCSYFLRKILSVGFGDLAMKQDMIHGMVTVPCEEHTKHTMKCKGNMRIT